MSALDGLTATTLAGETRDLGQYAGRVVLVVNTASACGFTPQYAGLEELHRAHHDQGLAILGFPCNQFKQQEPGSAEQISEFCQVNYGVTFDMFGKVDVNGPGAHPLFRRLIEAAPEDRGEDIGWNFTKFLIGRDGTVLHRYGPPVEPAAIEEDVVAALGAEPQR